MKRKKINSPEALCVNFTFEIHTVYALVRVEYKSEKKIFRLYVTRGKRYDNSNGLSSMIFAWYALTTAAIQTDTGTCTGVRAVPCFFFLERSPDFFSAHK